ncbi:MAG: hypothetical protein JOY71_23330 [Acetobacteraceae bacterium]|nr:hypothetical protein [Acetobacteraceae bacterium]MBV8525016.1 hypothetical protein [Acetobacteraceae bacterium]
MTANDSPPFTPEELSTHLWERHRIRRSTSRLARLRHIGGGPPFFRDGVHVRYPRRESDDWALAQLGRLVSSTAEEMTA